MEIFSADHNKFKVLKVFSIDLKNFKMMKRFWIDHKKFITANLFPLDFNDHEIKLLWTDWNKLSFAEINLVSLGNLFFS